MNSYYKRMLHRALISIVFLLILTLFSTAYSKVKEEISSNSTTQKKDSNNVANNKTQHLDRVNHNSSAISEIKKDVAVIDATSAKVDDITQLKQDFFIYKDSNRKWFTGALLTFIGLIIAAISLFSFSSRREIEKMATEMIDRRVQSFMDAKSVFLSTSTSSNDGHIRYEDFVESGRAYEWILTSAIRHTREAITQSDDLTASKKVHYLSKQDQAYLQYVKALAKSNLVYYLAEQQKITPQDAEEIDTLAVDARKIAINELYEDDPETTANILESCAFALYRIDHIEDAEDIILKIYNDKNLPKKFRDQILSDWSDKLEALRPEDEDSE